MSGLEPGRGPTPVVEERKGRGALSWAWDQSVCTPDMQAMVDDIVQYSERISEC